MKVSRFHLFGAVTASALVLSACSGGTRTDGGVDATEDMPTTGDVALDTLSDALTQPGSFGAPCTRDTECSSGLCLSIGRCSRTCMGGTDCPNSPNWMCVALPGRGTTCDCTVRAMIDTACNGVDDDCNGLVDETSRTCGTACVDVSTNNMNCGNCGITCGGGTTCRAGRCECPTDRPTVCGTRCVATMTDPMNCGACGNVCPGGASGMTSCVGGVCGLMCPPGTGDCDGNTANGCETNTRSDLAHCGMCARACTFAHAMGTCSTGACVIGACEAGFGNCDSDPSTGCETDTRVASAHCGACGRACAPANGVGLCAVGMCTLASCSPGFANCDTMDTNGCEANLQTNSNNCGACGRVCPGATAPNTTAGCASGMCTFACVAGFADCDGNMGNGCERSVSSDPANCGACGRACGAGESCVAGSCVGRPVVVQVAPSAEHTCARLADGTVRCWGRNLHGQLGDGTSTNRPTPVAVAGLTGAVEIATGWGHSCALLRDGTARCWGLNTNGQLGDGTGGGDRLVPVVVSGLGGAVEIASGQYHTCARLMDGTIRCWGRNGDGQIGDGSVATNRLAPVTVVGLTGAVEIAGGNAHTCARLSDGSVRCWGNNFSGQLGDGTTTDRLTFVPVMGLSAADEIALGGSHSCSRVMGGTARCWGWNDYGQLGDRTMGTNRLSPVVVMGLGGVVQVAAGGFHSCAGMMDGTARCWGENNFGQLGDGTMGTNRLTPVAVTGLSGVAHVAAAYGHTCAALTDGTVRCWGLNSYGQLGDGTAVNRLTPVAVTGL